MRVKKNSRIFLVIRLFLVLVLLTMGCSKKIESPRDGGVRPAPQKSSKTLPGKTPATQRPYTVFGQRYTPLDNAQGYEERGLASWYGEKFHGRKTSNGETYNMYALTAAHKTLPMGTWVKVHNLNNDREITVRINDRGPFVMGRIIDLSYTGAKEIDMVGPGTARVQVTALGKATSFSKETQAPMTFTPMDYWQGNFTVQVGAFKVKTNAENYRKKLSVSYLNAHIIPYEDDRGRFYRVRIGQFSKLEDAIQFSENLLTEGFEQAFAVAEE